MSAKLFFKNRILLNPIMLIYALGYMISKVNCSTFQNIYSGAFGIKLVILETQAEKITDSSLRELSPHVEPVPNLGFYLLVTSGNSGSL